MPAYYALAISLFHLFTLMTFKDDSGFKLDDMILYCMLPFLFVFVGMSLERLQQQNRDLQKQIDELKSQQSAMNDETGNGD